MIDDITFDLSSDLDPEVWQPLHPLGLHRAASAPLGPELVFPWTPAIARRLLEKDGPIIEVLAGSTISIRQITERPIETARGDLEHPQNRDRRLAFLKVTTPSGTEQPVKRPLAYLPTGAIGHFIEVQDYGSAYQGMLSRLGGPLEVEDVEDLVDQPPETWPRFPAHLPRSLALAMVALANRDDLDGHAMAAFGYMIGRAEAEQHLLLPAERGVKSVKNASGASAAKAAKDREKAQPVLDAAAKILARRTSVSLTACAKLVAEETGKDQGWVARKIRVLFIKDDNGRTYRPRRPADSRSD
ncbi:hypothetical protein [Brevundimonas sp.]|uniref:hypothetical protein n=1 Tax=Brevundimonas sp. TaxID=1871086 RepID=UPI003D0A09E9